MKLATFTHGGATRIGVVVEDSIVDLAAAATDLPREMIAFLDAGPRAIGRAAGAAKNSAHRIALASVKLEAPIARPPEFLAIGLNYADHVEETKMKRPEFPMFFNKQSSCVTGPGDPIHLPRASSALDYEGELGFVIGRRCRHVPRARAHEVIAGYLIVNDVSVRDWQRRSPTMTLGKSFSYEQAQDWGIVSDIYEGSADEFREQITDYARQFTTPNKAPMAVGFIKRSVQTGWELPLQDALALERELQAQLFKSDDAKEGIGAYTEKRVARFKNK